MVDLDSNPTKLIEIVEVGKQLLITRGALTTFSIANDIAKYFAILPAIFVATYAAAGESEGPLAKLNVMDLGTPQSAIISAIVFNALVIPLLVPIALRGVKYRAVGATALLRRNLLDLRPRRPDRAVRRHQAHRPDRPQPAGGVSCCACESPATCRGWTPSWRSRRATSTRPRRARRARAATARRGCGARDAGRSRPDRRRASPSAAPRSSTPGRPARPRRRPGRGTRPLSARRRARRSCSSTATARCTARGRRRPVRGRRGGAPRALMPRGRHKVFLGMAAGVGKTYRMLQEGRADGRDTVIGLLETHGRRRDRRARRGVRARPAARGRLPRHDRDRDGPPGDPRTRAAAVPDRRARAHQRAGRRARQALRGRRGRARGGHRRLLDAQRPAPGVAQRPARRAQRRARARDAARPGAAARRRGRARSTSRPRRCSSACARAGSTRPSASTPRSTASSGSRTSPRCARPRCARSPRRSSPSGASRCAPAPAVGERLLALVQPQPSAQRLVRRAWRSAQRLGADLDVLWVQPPGRAPTDEPPARSSPCAS